MQRPDGQGKPCCSSGFLTAEIGELREKLKLAKRIIKDSPALEEKLETEKQLIREWYFPERQRNKEKDYEGR